MMTINSYNESILIVDDNPINLEVLSESLTQRGFQVAVAVDGLSALEQVQYHLPALILLDIMMPELDGFETCQRLKNNPTTAEIPVIFMTALADTENKLKGFSLGAVDYITKPFHQEEVLARVKMQLKLHKLTKTLEKQNQRLKTEIEQREKTQILLKEAKKKADQANKAKSEFLANMSHEVRTPLNGILGYAQILQMSKNLTEKERKGINIIQQCGSHLLTLINDILDLSKIEAQKMDLYPTSFHFPSFLQGVAEIFSIRAEQKKIGFISQLDPDLPNGIHADEKRLRQVLINLLGNSVKFTEHGAVTLRVKVVKLTKAKSDSNPQQLTATINFQIEDTGVGISPDKLEKIFLPFEQVGDSKSQSQGTGLGLAITHNILALMNSRIQVTSQVGKGSVFSFDLEIPIVKMDDLTRYGRSSSQGVITGFKGGKNKILVVDDRWENRSVIFNLLQPLGFEIVEANNGQEGLDKAIEWLPDLILADLVMPVMDGFELIRRLRREPQLEGVIIIASSASVFEAEQCESITAGANDFLTKPISTESLMEMLRSFLELEWIYETQEQEKDGIEDDADSTSSASNSDQTNAEQMIPPGADMLTQLYTLAKKGDLDGIIDLANQLNQQEPKFRAFTQELCRLAENFQVKQLQSFIQEYISS
jgi:CheY-like chemotaxis protein